LEFNGARNAFAAHPLAQSHFKQSYIRAQPKQPALGFEIVLTVENIQQAFTKAVDAGAEPLSAPNEFEGKNSKNGLLIDSLIDRVKKNSVKEIILATSASVEGETTSYYVADSLKDTKVKITRLARGVPVGGEIEFLDDGTLFSAFKNRGPIISD